MKTRNKILTGAAALALATLAVAHHVPVSLSHVMGSEMLREVVFFTDSGQFGVPPYVHGEEEIEHHQPLSVATGDTVSIKHAGEVETIVFGPGDFADIGAVEVEEFLDVLSAKSALIDAFDTNGFAVVRGTRGGDLSALTLTDLVGSAFGQMNFQSGTTQLGSDDIVLDVSLPGDPAAHPLAGRPYVVLVSATEGESRFRGATVPLGFDALTGPSPRAARAGTLPGFAGTLDARGDAQVKLRGSLLVETFATSFPDELHFAYVVLGRPAHVAFVSNRFTVDFR